ncbi:MAG: ABC transporter permease [Fimbriimonadaceae bacterium]|nr:ABC transporter permease [Fimbriimonadaceae bacterium]QYK55744.1 MAG: ABC transporter permease [Fimbriimonadaceae bacterium]
MSSSLAKTSRAVGLRLFYGLLSLLFVSFVTFVADEVSPGDAAMARAGEKASPEAIARIRHEMGLDRPWPERYLRFVGNAARGDFGVSYFGTRQPVSEIIQRALPMTAKIAFLAVVLASGIGIFLGTLAAVYQHHFIDKAALSLSTLGVTLPNFVLIPIFQWFFTLKLGILPLSYEAQLKAPEIYYLVLPVIVMSARPTAMLARLTRASMIDVLQQEFIKLAIAKGVPTFRVYTVHALRNALLPVLTAIGSSFGILLTGSFITETAFMVPGLGREAIQAIQKRDTPVILATVLVTGALFILVNLIVDILMPLVDPRIRDSQV